MQVTTYTNLWIKDKHGCHISSNIIRKALFLVMFFILQNGWIWEHSLARRPVHLLVVRDTFLVCWAWFSTSFILFVVGFFRKRNNYCTVWTWSASARESWIGLLLLECSVLKAGMEILIRLVGLFVFASRQTWAHNFQFLIPYCCLLRLQIIICDHKSNI